MVKYIGRLGMECIGCGLVFPSEAYVFEISGFDRNGRPVSGSSFSQNMEDCPRCGNIAGQLDNLIALEKWVERIYDHRGTGRLDQKTIKKLQSEVDRLNAELQEKEDSKKFTSAISALRVISPEFACILVVAKQFGFPVVLVGAPLLLALQHLANGSNRTVRELFKEEFLERIRNWLGLDEAA